MASIVSSFHRARRARPALVASATISAALLVAACGGGDDDAEVVDSTNTTEAEATTTTASGSVDALPTGVEVDTTVWFQSFEIGLAEPAISEETAGSPELTLDVQLENLSEGSRNFSGSSVQLWVNDEQTITGSYDGDSVPELGRGTGTLSFDVADLDPDIDLTEAELRFGTESENQAIVPLDGEDVVSLEPLEFEVGEEAVVGTFTFGFTEAVVEFNDVAGGRSLDADTALLVLTYDASLAAGDYSSNRSIPVGEWRLELPDGDQVSYDDSTGDNSTATGTTIRGNTIIFPIVMPVGGDYVLSVVAADEANDPVTVDVTITVPDEDEGDSDDTATTTTTES